MINAPTLFEQISSANKFKEVISTFKLLFGTNEEWYDNEIIREGMKVITSEEKDALYEEVMKIFPFTVQQLYLIRELVYDKYNERSLFIVTGVGGSGKSTFGNLVKQIFKGDVWDTSIDKLQGFELAPAVKHRLIYGEELGAKDLDNSNLKIIASKQSLGINNKFGDIENIKTQSNMLFCCNNRPLFDITDSGLLRRICYYHMNKKIENPDRTMNKKEFTKEQLIKICTYCYNMEKHKDDWFEKFFRKDTYTLLYKDNKIAKVGNPSTYELFTTACRQKGLKAYSEPVWQEMREIFNGWNLEILSEQVRNT